MKLHKRVTKWVKKTPLNLHIIEIKCPEIFTFSSLKYIFFVINTFFKRMTLFFLFHKDDVLNDKQFVSVIC